MPTSRPPLSYDVFVAPEKPFIAPPSRVGDPPAWDPTTSTFIFGARDTVLVDSLTTVREAAAFADWVALHERRLTTISSRMATATITWACPWGVVKLSADRR